MNVQELLDRLSAVKDKTALIVMSRDPEGNGFSELYEADTSELNAFMSDGYDSRLGFKEITPELEKYGYNQDDVVDGKTAIVLWPE